MKSEILLYRVIRNIFLLMLCISAVFASSYAAQYTLTTTVIGPGSISLSPLGGVYNLGDTVTVIASANPGFHFWHWSGGPYGTGDTIKIIMNSNMGVLAYFGAQLIKQVTGSGSVSLRPSGDVFGPGANVYMIAIPDSGYHFDHWSGDFSGTDAYANIIMNSNKNIIANFDIGAMPMPSNWRNIMGPVENQICGNCWAHASTGAIEGMLHRSLRSQYPNICINLDEKWLADQGWGGNDCTGGFPELTLLNILNYKVPSVATGIFPNLEGVRWGVSTVSPAATNRQAKKYFLSFGPITTIYDTGPTLHSVAIVSYDDVRQAWLCKDSRGVQNGDSGYVWIAYNSGGISNNGSNFVTVDPSCYAKIVPELIPSLPAALGYGFVPDEWIYYTGSQILSGPSTVNFSTNNTFVVTGTLLIPSTIAINNPPTYKSNSYLLTLNPAATSGTNTYKFNNLNLGTSWNGRVITSQSNLLQAVGEGYFLKWSDGVTQNPRTIPLSNNNITLNAVFGYVLSGHVYKNGYPNTPLDSVLLNGLPHPSLTGTSGAYGDQVPYGWSGTVTPSRVGYTFTPASRTYTNVTSNIVNDDYAATQTNYTISGYVKVNGTVPLSGVVMNRLPGNPVTNSSGYYSALVGHGWSDTVRPKKASYVFAPGWQSYRNVTSNKTQNYIATFAGGKIIMEPENNSQVLGQPQEFALFQNVPNPFNPSTVINYQLPVAGNVSLKVFDMLGQEVATLVEGTKEAGYYSVSFDGSKLASGIYLTRFVAQTQEGEPIVQVKKMILTK